MLLRLLIGVSFTLGVAISAHAQTSEVETITIATVNNGDMVLMQELSEDFTNKNPSIKLEWVTLEENILRQRVTTDIAAKGGQLGKDYDVDDILPPIRGGLSLDGALYAAPFYGESSMVMYRTDLMEKADLEMPKAPTWEFIAKAAEAMTDKENGVYGICLRGKAGWGENVALLTAMSNSFGARWFDEEWNPQLDSDAWQSTMDYYLNVMNNFGPPGASSNGFNENLALFQTGKCGMWIDATVAGAFVTNEEESTVADSVGFALAPDNGLGKRGNWLWAWSLAIPAGTEKSDAAQKFVSWATSKDYQELVASKKGWRNVPPGTRTSLYKNQEYLDAAPFAQITLDSINSADPNNPTVQPVPYVGVQFVAIPEFQSIGTSVGQQLSAALAGKVSAKEALENSQRLVTRSMTKAGYYREE